MQFLIECGTVYACLLYTSILFTLIVKLVLLPFQLKSKKSMLRMGRMNSKVQELSLIHI